MELAQHATELTLTYLNRHRRQFKEITRQAQSWFDRRDWELAREGLNRRSELYAEVIHELITTLQVKMGSRFLDRRVWLQMKDIYEKNILNRSDEELSETFFNSLTRAVFRTVGFDRELEFIWLDRVLMPSGEESPVFKSWYLATTVEELVIQLLESYTSSAPWRDLAGDANKVAHCIVQQLESRASTASFDAIEMIEPPLFRGKSAYLVGRIRRGHRIIPLILPLAHDDDGVFVDAVIQSELEMSTIFSFTRSYFLVDVERPMELVGFIRSLLPSKPLEELYISLGYTRHGKTVRYRGLYRHLEQSEERFEMAPGAKGMVMAVFHLPSHHLVFKVIRDRFAEPKTTSREQVHATYRLVETHDRAGRLVDAKGYERLIFPKKRFSEDVLDELLNECSDTVRCVSGEVIIEQIYIERKVYPLNLYVHEVEEHLAIEAVIDHGQAIKDLAAVGLFPGDMLVKNFGVTRRGRVVFYDYDEVIPLLECRFKCLPEGDAYAGESMVVADEKDIFPEELRYFIWSTAQLRKVFEEHHSEIFTVSWWKSMQAAIRRKEFPNIYPYPKERRLHNSMGSSELEDQSHQEPS